MKIQRWIRHRTPEFEKRQRPYVRPLGGSWKMDKTRIKDRSAGPGPIWLNTDFAPLPF